MGKESNIPRYSEAVCRLCTCKNMETVALFFMATNKVYQ